MKRYFLTIIAGLLSVLSLSSQTLSLDSCFALARRNSYAIKTAKLDVEEAQEVKKQAFTKYFPQVAATAMGYKAFDPLVEMEVEDIMTNDDFRGALDAFKEWLLGNFQINLPNLPSPIFSIMSQGIVAQLGAVQPIYLGGRIVNGNRLAKVGIDAAKTKEFIAERDVLLAVEESYWIVVDLEAKRQTVEAVQKLLDTVHNIVGTAVTAGLAVQNDLLEIELRQDELAAQKIRLNNGISLARQALCQSIGIPYNENLKLEDFNKVSASASMVDTKSAVQSRPEYSLLEIQLKAERLKRKMTLAESLPSVIFGVTYGYANYVSPFDPSAKYQFVDIDQKRFMNGLVGLTVTVPITGWWETSHKLKQSDIKIKKAELQKSEFAEKMELQTTQAFNSTVETEALVKQYSSSVTKAAENLRLARLNYKSGLQTVTDILQAQALYLQAQNNLIDARIENRMAVKKYEAYTKAQR
ncbi:MAG: TolC family protein [Paludibacteraceae bacterium]|nr:TolC family protein [Paludibacteraceae bacterium]